MSDSSAKHWLQTFIPKKETFIPTKEVKVTPIIISANVLMYVIMVINGVHPLTPDTEELRAWGASSATDIAGGDYWRLLTSNYLHGGLIHLAVNMLSLNNLGRMLEQFIGAWRLAVIYTLSGIFACGVSIWWNPFAIGVGASGAILGVAGILLALLTTNLIDKKIRFRMLRSMLISVAMMVLIGFIPNVDNAAHIAGAAAGMLGGYFIYPELRAHYSEHKKQYTGLIAFALVIAGGSVWFATHARGIDTQLANQITMEFEYEAALAEGNFQQGEYKTAEEVDQNVVEIYRYGLLAMKVVKENIGNPESAAFYEKMTEYINARKRYYEWVCTDLVKNIPKSDSTVYWQNTSDSLHQLVK